MEERRLVLLVILSAVAVIAAVMLVIGWRTQAPPGQIGLKGTGMERSRALYRLQMVLLGALLAACLWAALALV